MTPTVSFQAAILEKSKAALTLADLEFSGPLLPGQVLVRIDYSGICGAQINEIDAVKGPDRFLPHLLGHEGFGEVIETGPAVSAVAPGQSVVLHWMQGTGIQSAPPTYKWGNQGVNAGWVTTLSQMAVVSENRCTPVESSLSPTLLPIFGCAATTAAGVVGKEAQVRLGESVVVLGAGGVGLLSIMAARASGAAEIIAVDIAESRMGSALKSGATLALQSGGNHDLKSEIVAKLGGPPDVIIETSGARVMIELAYELAQPNGRAILVGVPRVDEPALIETLALHFGMVFTGSKGGSTEPGRDIPLLVRAAEQGIFPVEKIPITIFPLSAVNEAFDALRAGEPGRMVIACQN
jgi:Zn-dependent alcohol dehydrogenase